MSSRSHTHEAPTLVVRSIRVRPNRHRRHAIIRIIGEAVQTAGRQDGVVHVIGGTGDGPAAA